MRHFNQFLSSRTPGLIVLGGVQRQKQAEVHATQVFGERKSMGMEASFEFSPFRISIFTVVTTCAAPRFKVASKCLYHAIGVFG